LAPSDQLLGSDRQNMYRIVFIEETGKHRVDPSTINAATRLTVI